MLKGEEEKKEEEVVEIEEKASSGCQKEANGGKRVLKASAI